MPPTKGRSAAKSTTRSTTKSTRGGKRTTKAEQPVSSEEPTTVVTEEVADTTATPTRARSRSTKAVSQASLSAAKSALESVPVKETQSLNLLQTIAQLQSSIEGALDKGYTHAEVAEMLGSQGIEISGSTLKRYLSVSKPASAKRGGGRRGSRKSSAK
ncbi:hypothetical protein [Thermocoleostomius sinensis]|uniref:Uncharacterized protein n=1 Tax=Thermocoleostomius sinensis A174 TaxID=2016057 RepID=A0A9E9C6G1_9CYAN|nr:hypothetical protein [Thermocoleostomius sinensis]WAL59224.1 hypothetical protein OXH18_18905 [Thermocoleostomius sinensis A174]